MLLRAADDSKINSDPVNIVSDDERTTMEIAAALAKISRVDLAALLPPSEPQSLYGRLEPKLRTQRAFARNAYTSLETGLRLTYAWYSRESRQFV
jgi:nucleoside-diphosphate-sugar epimerase